MKTVALVGTFDSKAEEFAYVKQKLLDKGFRVLTVHCGSFAPAYPVDVNNDYIAMQAGYDLADLLSSGQRGPAMAALQTGVKKVLVDLHKQGAFQGVLSLGGSGGTALVAPALQELELGVPKVIVSTMAGGNVAPYVGLSDIIMIPAIVDVAGINVISRRILSNAVGALCGMLETTTEKVASSQAVAATMFGLTTKAVTKAKEIIEAAGYEVLVFHATGTGGRTMEKLINAGYFAGVLDLTTTEWCDELCGGILNAGPHRSEAASKMNIPQVVVPGAMDMVNFAAPESVPERYRERLLYHHNPAITLMRTSLEENRALGAKLAEKVNLASSDCAVLLPTKGFSDLDKEGYAFYDEAADRAFIESFRAHLTNPIVEVEEVAAHINDVEFAVKAANKLVTMLNNRR